MTQRDDLGGFPISPKDNGAREAIRDQQKQSKRLRRAQRIQRLGEHGESMQRRGDQMASAGKSMFWFGVCLLFVVFVSIPILTHLF